MNEKKIISGMFSKIDDLVKNHLRDSEPEKALFNIYSIHWEKTKESVCTSSGFTGFTEMLFFRYVIQYMESQLDEKFKAEKHSKDTKFFRSENYIVTRDIFINKFLVNAPRYKPDIAILRTYKNRPPKLLAAFEIKTYISDHKVLDNMINKLKNLFDSSNAYIFIALNSKQYTDELYEFCSKDGHKGRIFIISPHEFQSNISLNSAMKKIVRK